MRRKKQEVHIPLPLTGFFMLASGLLCAFSLGRWWGLAAGLCIGYGIGELFKWAMMTKDR
jgi:hypothetical protein